MHLKCMCTLFHQLCFLGAFAIADPHPFQESELVFPEVFPDTSPPAQDKPDSRDSDASAGSSSREVRSISNWDESPELDHLQSPRPQTRLKLKIPAFGRDLHMIVKKDTRFLSQKFMVERRYKAGKASPNNGPGSTAANAEETCYYSGTVLNEEGSIVSFSTCAGLMGFIQISDDFLYIEPVNRTVAVTGQAHRVYRRKRSADDRTHQEADNTREKQTTGCKVIPEKLRSKTKRPTDGGRGKRYSYKLLPEYNVETLVVADPAMVSYHGTEAAKRFILTIMNMVFNLFQHKSLGIQMNIRLTKLVLLHDTPTDMYIGHHGEKMLESFCHWQQEEYGRKSVHSDFSTRWREDLPSVDTAILITRPKFFLQGARILGIPIIVSEQYPKGLGSTVQELDLTGATLVFPKTKFSMVLPEVEATLTDLPGVRSVVLFGVETHVCIQQTALDLIGQGYEVHIVADSTSSRSMMDRMFALERMARSGIIITTSESVLLQLVADKEHPKFKEVQNIIKATAPESGLLSKI